MATVRHLWCRGSSGQQSCTLYDDDGDDGDDDDDCDDNDDSECDDYILRALKTQSRNTGGRLLATCGAAVPRVNNLRL